jgi:Bifunctional DNA primase/polymerase, N-terminal/AAA domain/Primase C terminal 1 (PriCT-1)
MSELLCAIERYQAHGLSVIPIHPREKTPLIQWQQYQSRRATEKETTAWWSKWPDANVGIVTGAISGLAVVDLDSVEAKDKLKQLLPDLTSVPRSRTGKGWQLFFKYPAVTIHNPAGVLPGLDVRGDGGYVVAPPSIHPNGKQYKWEVPINGELPKFPVELFKLISSKAAGNENGYRERFNTAQALAGVPEGQRDETIFRLACKLRSADVPQDMAEALILEAAENCVPPFSGKIALEKVGRAYRKYEPKRGEEKATGTGHFSLIQAKDLLASEEPETEWLWEGILPAGGLSLLVAKPKVGKTTLAFNLALAVAGGRDFLARKTKKSPVVYLALEEKRSEIRKKLKALGETPEEMSFHFGSAPEKAIQEVKNLIKETKAGFLIVDVLQKFCRIKDLNDYAQVTNTLEPLMETARDRSCHILLTHHAGKADRQDGDDILGSTALLGGVDTLVQIKKREQRRTFFTIQRYGEDTPETVIELKPDGSLQAVGSRQHVEIEETIPLVIEALAEERLQEKEIWLRVEKKHDLTAKALRLAVKRGEVNRSGSGKKGDPYRYEKCSPFSPQNTMGRAGRESESNIKPLKLRQECSPQNLDVNSLRDGSPGREFLIQETLRIFPGARVIQEGAQAGEHDEERKDEKTFKLPWPTES